MCNYYQHYWLVYSNFSLQTHLQWFLQTTLWERDSSEFKRTTEERSSRQGLSSREELHPKCTDRLEWEDLREPCLRLPESCTEALIIGKFIFKRFPGKVISSLIAHLDHFLSFVMKRIEYGKIQLSEYSREFFQIKFQHFSGVCNLF